MTSYGRDVLYTLGSPVGYSDHLLADMSIFMAAYLVRYKILRCTVPDSFYETCDQMLADECDDNSLSRVAIIDFSIANSS
jgi:hypothetical protein